MQAPPSAVVGQTPLSNQGLTSEEARLRLAEGGSNEPTPVPRTALLRQVLCLFTHPLVVILLMASVIAGALGEGVNASIIAVMVLLSMALNFIQSARSQRAAARLRAAVAPTGRQCCKPYYTLAGGTRYQ